MDEDTIQLWQVRDNEGVQSLWATLHADGSLTIEGQDLGPGVEEALGVCEYEYVYTIKSVDVPILLEHLGGDDLLIALKLCFAKRSDDVQKFLDEHEVPYDFYNRMGD